MNAGVTNFRCAALVAALDSGALPAIWRIHLDQKNPTRRTLFDAYDVHTCCVQQKTTYMRRSFGVALERRVRIGVTLSEDESEIGGVK